MLLVEGIRPVLPLIRNTPYGKRIQNKLQREQATAENFGYHAPQGMMPMGNPGHHGHGHHSAGARHVPQGMHHTSGMTDIYGAQGGVYGIQGQGSYGHSHLGPQMHGLQARSMDGYAMQGTSPHSASLTPPHTGYTGVAGYANVSPFGTLGLSGSLNDPYQSYGYGM